MSETGRGLSPLVEAMAEAEGITLAEAARRIGSALTDQSGRVRDLRCTFCGSPLYVWVSTYCDGASVDSIECGVMCGAEWKPNGDLISPGKDVER